MPFLTETTQPRSRTKRKCKLQPSNYSQNPFSSNTDQLLTDILQIDTSSQLYPHEIHPYQIQTYAAFSHSQLTLLLSKPISRETLKRIIIDTLKLCYLYSAIMQALESQISSTRDEYKLKDVLRVILHGHFYQFLLMKTQSTKFLFNNRTTDVNVKTIVSGIVIVAANRLNIKTLSDVVLFYRLEEALYQTAPHGLPFEFQKIIKAMKKVDRNITAQKFSQWQKRVLALQKDRKFLQQFHFAYLMSLSEPVSKKKQCLFEAQRRESKLEKHSQLMTLMNEKSNFISAETHKASWKNDIKVRGLSFQHKSQSEHISSMKSEFADLRKRIISHKRIKSATIRRKAVDMVKKDLVEKREKQNQSVLMKEYLMGKKPEKQRALLKKHNKLWMAQIKFQAQKSKQTKKFTTVYQKQMQKHTVEQKQQEEDQSIKAISPEPQQVLCAELDGEKEQDEEFLDIYSHHLTRILANTKYRSMSRDRKLSKAQQRMDKMLQWL